MRSTLILVGVLLGAPAYAADWIDSCRESAAGVLDTAATVGVNAVTAVRPGQFACAETGTNSDDTTILYIGDCASVQVYQYDDPDGDDDESLVVGTPHLCPSPDLSAAEQDLACGLVPDGAALAGAVDANYNVVGRYLKIVAGGTTDASANVRWEAFCSETARP